MKRADAQEQLRPCDVVVKLLKNKHAAPFSKDEMEILSGYLNKLPIEKLGAFAKKRVREMSDEEFGDLIRKKIEGVLNSEKRTAGASGRT